MHLKEMAALGLATVMMASVVPFSSLADEVGAGRFHSGRELGR